MLSRDLHDRLLAVSTATLTTVLLKKGIRRAYMRGPKPLATAVGKRIAGEAFTLRFVPAREDLATPESWSSPKSTRGAIEDMPEGVIAVVDAMGILDAGIFGDILCARMAKREARFASISTRNAASRICMLGVFPFPGRTTRSRRRMP